MSTSQKSHYTKDLRNIERVNSFIAGATIEFQVLAIMIGIYFWQNIVAEIVVWFCRNNNQSENPSKGRGNANPFNYKLIDSDECDAFCVAKG